MTFFFFTLNELCNKIIIGGSMKEIKTFEDESYGVKVVTKEELVNNRYEYFIRSINLDDKLIFNGDVSFIFNDLEHPITYNDFLNHNELSINEEYLKGHSEEINDLLVFLIKDQRAELTISNTALITPEVIDAIAANDTITRIKLGNLSDIYYLDEATFNKLNNGMIKHIITDGVDESLKDNYDEKIYYNCHKKIIGYRNIESIKEDLLIDLDEPITDEQVKFFNYSSDNIKILFNYEDYDNIFDTISKLRQLNKGYKYTVKIDDKNKFNDFILDNDSIDKSDILVYVNRQSVDVDKYVSSEKMLLSMIEPAKDLSNFEKFLYAYDIVKHFKKYKESDDTYNSRDLYQIINNDEYMVCVGYANLLIDLLNKLDIDSYDYSVGVDVGFDIVDLKSEKVRDDVESRNAGHARVIVNMVDHKYNIDGIYVSDPTWDNELGNDSYTYALMTFDEISKGKRYLYQDRKVTGLLDSKNIQQFYDGVNKRLNKKMEGKENYLSMPTDNKKAQSNFISEILKFIKDIDKEFYNKINDEAKNILVGLDYDQSKFNSLIEEIGYYIINKNSKPISLDSYKKAIKVLCTNFYGLSEEDVLKEINRTIDYNKKRFDQAFPDRYKINQDGSKEIYSSLNNKWDEEKITRHR